MVDMAKLRRESIRWTILLTLNNGRPAKVHEKIVLSVLRSEFPDATQNEARREMEYLDGRALIKIMKAPDGVWSAKLSRDGVDVVEYTVDVEPGIARPEKYFDA